MAVWWTTASWAEGRRSPPALTCRGSGTWFITRWVPLKRGFGVLDPKHLCRRITIHIFNFCHLSGRRCQQEVCRSQRSREPWLGGGAQATTATEESSEGEDSLQCIYSKYFKTDYRITCTTNPTTQCCKGSEFGCKDIVPVPSL